MGGRESSPLILELCIRW